MISTILTRVAVMANPDVVQFCFFFFPMTALMVVFAKNIQVRQLGYRY